MGVHVKSTNKVTYVYVGERSFRAEKLLLLLWFKGIYMKMITAKQITLSRPLK